MAKTKKTSSNGSRKPSSSSTRAHNQSQAQLRTNRNNGGNSLPKSIQDVYDFAVESSSGDGSKKARLNKGDKSQQRAMRRAMAGMQDSDPYADLKSKGKGKGKQRDRDQEDDDDESIDDEDEADEEEIRDFLRAPKVFDDLDELNAGIEGDDEDIDSDEAFGESDEERFEGWTFSGGKGKRVEKSQDDDDDEEEEEEDEEDGDDMMDLSKLLDGDGSENDDDDDDSDDQDSDLDQDSSSSQQGDSKLQAILSNLSAKRSLEEGSDQEGESSTNPSKKQRKVLSERTESMPESEFASGTSSQQLRLEDLLSPLNGQNGLTSLRNSTKALISSGNGSDKKTVASKKGGGTLNAPLPSVVQDRLDRKAAYELTKDEVEGWKPTIKRLREAQHLSFPLQETKPDQTSTASLTSNFKAQKGGIEDEISKMLNESGMTEKQLKEEEELKMKELDPQEVKRRRDELKKMRELMFRAELKAKRISKIKSKAYRKINRKEKERERLKLKEAGLLNGDDQDDLEMDEEERMKMERERAKERATLKHKNTSKWAKNSLNRNHQTAESRNAIEDQLRRGEELRRKIHGLNSDSDEDEEDDSDDEEEDEEDGREKIFDELKSLERRDEKQRLKDEEELDGKHKNVMNMKFMKDARKKTEAKNRGDLDEFQNQMERMGKNRDGETLENEEEIEGLENKRMIGSGGRAVYGNGKIETRASNVVNPFSMDNGSSTIASDSTSPTLQASDDAEQDLEVKLGSSNPSGNRNPFSLDHHSNSEGSSQAANPWLSSTSKNQTQSKKKNQVLIGKEGKASDKLGNKVEKQGKKSDEARRNELEDAKMEISLTSNSNKKKGNQSKIKVSSNDHDDENEDGIDSDFKDSESDEDEEVEEPTAISGKGIKTTNPNAFKQRKLVAQAFSGDDVSSDFALQKSKIIEQDAPKVEDLTLPGWGSWGGEGIKKPKSGAKKKFLKEIKGLDPEKRKDFNLKNVIINERKDKKNEKYKAKDLPFPYTSKAQYEMDMKNSLGKEWNTITQNQRLTLPKVVTKPGKVIKPIERKF